ncbi:MAG: hypothetical protein GX051_01725 [Clostridiales bacterium]|nr:hypothetical protein [Clostridiales bacterium]
MRIFDLHCDTVTECENKAKRLLDNDMHVSLSKASVFDKYCQIFAVWIHDELRGQAAVDYFDRVSAFFNAEIKANAGTITHITDGRQLSEATEKVCAILSVEGGAAAAGSLEGVEHLYDAGVRLMTLTWNAANEIASGCAEEGGLTPFGRDAIKHMERLGMTVDVSHLNKQGFFEVAQCTEKPFIASHSNCDIVDNFYGKRRNLTDEQIKIIIERGGLMGINLCRDFIETEDAQGMEAVWRHISHALELGAQDVLSLGADWDGCPVSDELNGIQTMPALYDYLIGRGLSRVLADKVFFGNAFSFFERYI